MRFISLLVALTACIMATVSCDSDGQPREVLPCEKRIPEHLPGLTVEGARNVDNVIRNLVPYGCVTASVFHEQKRETPTLKGEVLIQFTVEFQGELTNLYVKDISTGDSAFVAKLRDASRYIEFDPWGTLDDETDVTWRMSFGT
jgi:hypothetical protein